MKAGLLIAGILCACVAGACSESTDTPAAGDSTAGPGAGPGASPGAGPGAATTTAGPPRAERLVHLEALYGSHDAAFGESSFKVVQLAGEVTKELEVELEGGKPGSVIPVSVDGQPVGQMIVDLDGEADLELIEDGDTYFPEGFTDPKAGSIVKVGDLFDVELLTVERQVDLRANFSANRVVGEIKYKVDQLGERTLREFKLELLNATPGAVYEVAVDGVTVAECEIDLDGEAKLEFVDKDEIPFPANFTAPHARSVVKVGDLGEFPLEDAMP
jgi:hypothetical protein